MNYDFLQRVRLYELERALPYMPAGSRLLELGAGAGWQLQILAERGYDVDGIDLETSRYAAERVREITEYDGMRIPFEDDSFDVVFSSNVLEHILHVEAFQREIHRVLKADGIAVHIVPSATWRLWANVSHYLLLPERIASALSGKPHNRERGKAAVAKHSDVKDARSQNIVARLMQLLYPARHGEIGNCITEVYWFSRFRWRKLFHRTGWKVKAHCTSELCNFPFLQRYPILGVSAMHRLSYIMGSSCLIYVLSKASVARVSRFVPGA